MHCGAMHRSCHILYTVGCSVYLCVCIHNVCICINAHEYTITVGMPSCTGDICVVFARVDQVGRKEGNVSSTTSTAALTADMLDWYTNTNKIPRCSKTRVHIAYNYTVTV